MSSRKRKRTESPREDGAARAVPPSRRISKGMLGVGLVALVAVAGLVAWFIMREPNDESRGDARLAELPPPRASSSAMPVPADFAGPDKCASCHATQYATWRASTHGTAGGAPGDVKVIAPFNGTPIRFRDAVVIPAASGRRYTFLVRQDGHPDRTFVVDGVVGGGHMAGGGTQGFVSRFADGTWRFLPFDWSRQNSRWFCNSGTRSGKGWVPITPDLALADCGDWPPRRVLGDEPRFANCQGCHGSQIDVRLDTVAKRWQTHVGSLAIDCESCHGPAKQHIALMSSSARDTSTSIGLASLTTLDKDRSLAVCLTCHALKTQLTPGFLPGGSLLAAYSLRLSQLGDAALLPDGRTRTFAYQEGHLSSACYLKGGMTCTSCHDPHSQRYRDAFGAALPGRVDDRQCTSCHASKAENPTAHTKHPAASEGSRCTSCHMPYLQQPETGHAIRYARSDHTIAIPRPVFDASQGITSACRSCHGNREEAALDAQVRTWYGALAPHEPVVAAVSSAEQAKPRLEAARLLLVSDSRHTSAVFAGLARFVEKWLSPDMTDLEPQVADRLRALARYDDVDVRATALAALHFARGGDASTRGFLADALRGPGVGDAPVRTRWATVLGFLADSLLAGGNASAAVTTYRKAVEITPEAPRLYLNLGLAQVQAGDLAGAVASYKQSLTLEPRQPLVLVNLGIALESSGDASQAESAYRRAAAMDPNEPLAHFNLGNVYLKRGDAAAAIPEYERAASLDPSLAKAHFYLADAYARTGALRRALDEVRRGLEFDPQNAEARSVAARLEQAIAGSGAR